jgi:hypothetical protein
MIKRDNNDARNEAMKRIHVVKTKRREMHDWRRKARQEIIAKRNEKIEKAEAGRLSEMTSTASLTHKSTERLSLKDMAKKE